MAATAQEIEVRSPYSGEVVGRVRRAGADDARRAIDAAEAAMREPLPAHKRAEILVRVAGALGRRHDEAARLISALLLAELEAEAGLPAGWLTVLVGPSAEIGDVIVEDERVKAISFTGSGPVGWGLKERAPKKRVALELGNATPVIVAADADLETAAAKVAANAFSFAGQSCISVQRVYVEE